MSTASSNTETTNPRKTRQAPKGVPVFRAGAPFEGLSPAVQRDFEAVQEMLRAYGTMVAALLETGEDCSLYSNGIHLIHQLVLLQLDEVADFARARIEDMHSSRYLKKPHDGELMERVGRMIADAFVATGIDMEFDEMGKWTHDIASLYAKTYGKFMRELRLKIEDDDHLLSVGSFLPWVEAKIWREVAGIDLSKPSVADRVDEADERASLALEVTETEGREASPVAVLKGEVAKRLHEDGHTVAQISQILNIKRSAVERILGRLHATEPEQQTA